TKKPPGRLAAVGNSVFSIVRSRTTAHLRQRARIAKPEAKEGGGTNDHGKPYNRSVRPRQRGFQTMSLAESVARTLKGSRARPPRGRRRPHPWQGPEDVASPSGALKEPLSKNARKTLPVSRRSRSHASPISGPATKSVS